jgi:hypothetical protein
MDNNIKLVRLNTGEDVIASVSQTEDPEAVFLDSPMRLVLRRSPSGTTMMMMSPWLPIEVLSENVASVYLTDIITVLDVKDSLVEYYNNMVHQFDVERQEKEEYMDEKLRETFDKEQDEYESFDIENILEERKKSSIH